MQQPLQTLDSLLEQAFNNFGDRDCLGIRTKGDDGSPGEYVFQTYASVRAEAQLAASGLLVMGLAPRDLVGIYSRNRPEWVVTALACNMVNMTIVPLYNSSGPNCLRTTLSKTKMRTVVCTNEYLKTLFESDLTNSVNRIIVIDPIELSHQNMADQYRVEMISWADLLRRGRTIPVFKGIPPRLNDLYCIMWTSGDPKGVMLTQENIVTAIHGLRPLGILPSDVHMSYLPLAHIFEHLAVLHSLVVGAAVGFWRGNVSELFDDLRVLRPSILLGVPSIFNRLHNSIVDRIQKSNTLSRLMFNYGFNSRLQARQDNQPNNQSTMWNRWVFKSIAQPLGGRLRLLVSAAAPLSVETANFLRVCLCPVVQFYGMTETAGAITFSGPESAPGSVGPPLSCNQVKLVDVPEMGYFASQKTGEIVVRGPNVSQGYFKDEEKTRAVFDQEGWLHTGDIGRWNPDGSLSLIDRKKNIFKLSQGEYIAVEYLEGVYSRSKFVRQVFVYGDSLQHYLVAIIVPNEKYAMDWAKESGLKDINDFSQLCRHPALKRKIFDDLMRSSAAQRLQTFEIVKNIHLESEAWSHENGLLTPAGKLIRQQLQKKYADTMRILYEQPVMEVKKAKL